MTSEHRVPRGRAVRMLAAVAVSVALVGFLVETRRKPERLRVEPLAERETGGEHVQAPRQADMGHRVRDERRTRHAAGLAALAADRPKYEPGTVQSAAARQAVRARRAERRAFEGAPPVIPHPIASRDYPSCLACHRDGMRVFGRTAPPVSHPEYTSCVQCHAPTQGPMEGRVPELAQGNVFQGYADATPGPRAWDGAPPVMPHDDRMRERCSSCHGDFGQGLRTSHPERGNCLQCHALQDEGGPTWLGSLR